ncbi:MAG TPA: HDOD domain-containing protein [Gammaproteobacteria bacterium]|nr:HDOD domain-containing protein [Gammaproteobacteria bacterium]
MEAERQNPEASAAELAQRLIGDVSFLVSPPDVCIKVFGLLESGSASAQEIGDVISHDPSLTARLLQLVNSSFFNFARRIDTVSRAITVLGTRELYSLVLAVSAIKSFSRLPITLVNIDTFWRHGIFTGLLAREIARKIRILHPERLFIAGLLHDIGSLVLYARMPDQMADLMLMSEGEEDVLHRAEQEQFGFSHGDLGGALARVWNLPEQLQDAITHHHDPEAGQSSDAAIIHLADALANRSVLGAFCEDPPGIAHIHPETWERLGMEPADLDEEGLIGDAGLQFTETAGLLLARG